MEKNHINCDHFLKPSCPNFRHKFALAFLAKETIPGHETPIITGEDGSNMNSLCEKCDSFETV